MRAYLILLILMCFGFANAQTNSAHFPVENFHMNERHSWRSIPDPYRFNYEEGSIFVRESYIQNNKRYYNLIYNCQFELVTGSTGQTYSGIEARNVGRINYDSLTRRLFLNDVLLYDFNLKLLDVYPLTTQNPSIDTSLRVRRIDTIIDPYNITRKVFFIARNYQSVINADYNSMNCAVIIEGIGNVNGLLSPLIDCFEDCSNELVCLKINNNQYLINESIVAGNCNVNNSTFSSADFPDSNYHWNEEHRYWYEPFNFTTGTEGVIYDNGDSLYQGKSYRKLYYKRLIRNDWNPAPHNYRRDTVLVGLIRNDKANKKVYYVDFYVEDSVVNEQLLYDFGLQVGDRYPRNFQNNNDPLLGDSIVQKIDTIIDPYNIKRAVYYLDTTNLQTSPIIQGIGNTRGLLINTLYNPFEFYYDFMSCMNINNSYKVSFYDYRSTFMSIDDCKFYQYTSIENSSKSKINIYPNPTNSKFYINHNDPNSTFEIINAIGQSEKIKGEFDGNEWSFDISDFENGIYVLKILSKGSSHFSKIYKQ